MDVVIDVESDGPCPHQYSMISLGAVVCDDDGKFDQTFKALFSPISNIWIPEALAISSITREQHQEYPSYIDSTWKFYDWLIDLKKKYNSLTMWSDNPAYDWQWVNYYLHTYCKRNPLGFSARRIGDLYCGVKGDLKAKWKYLRDTNHTHDPVDDAKGNAEALFKIKRMIEVEKWQ